MRLTEIKYAMLRRTDDFENDRVEVTMQIEEGDDLQSVYHEAKRLCQEALAHPGRRTEMSPISSARVDRW